MAKRRTKKPEAVPSMPLEERDDAIVRVLSGYKQEAKDARKGGMNPRDDIWEENINAYWGRYDFSKKAPWQAKVVMPEVPSFVDRFAAALKDALVATPSGFYTVTYQTEDDAGLSFAIKRATDVWLSQCGTNQLGTPLEFPAVFEEQCKMGAMMACCATVKWKKDVRFGRVAIETVNPQDVWLDHTYRNLYRLRRVEIDKHDLVSMTKARDGKGEPLWNLEGIERLVSSIEMEAQRQKELLTGTGQEITSARKPVELDEYIATVVDVDGKVLAEDALIVVGNDKFVLRGPEPNPFWHKKDWMVYTPLNITPLSVYGRSYMEDFTRLAGVFNQMTNLILDAVQTSTIRAYAVVPAMLKDPTQIKGGLAPNKMFQLEDGMRPEDFFKALDLGTLPGESVQIWQALKNEIMEAAARNEIGLGQFAPKSRTSATEVGATQESASAILRSVAQTLESRFLNLTLDRVWKTGFQHVQRDDPVIRAAVGPGLFDGLMQHRKELVSLPFTFQAKGISALVQKNRMLRSLLQLFQIMSQSDILLQAFLQVADVQKVMRLLFELSDVDLSRLVPSQEDQLARQFAAPQMLQGPTGPGPQGALGPEMRQLVQGIGVAR